MDSKANNEVPLQGIVQQTTTNGRAFRDRRKLTRAYCVVRAIKL